MTTVICAFFDADFVQGLAQCAGHGGTIGEVGGFQPGGEHTGAQGSEGGDNFLFRLPWPARNHAGAGDFTGQAGTQRIGFGGEDTVGDV